MSEELNEMVGDLLSQLTEAQTKAKEAEKELNPLKKEELEKFVVEKGGKLVEDSLEMIKNYCKEYLSDEA
jgi:sugar-specific transcriptional regulator TrmB